jgi:hypothetical protein
MTATDRFTFVLKAYATGTPWIAFESRDRQLQGEGLPTGIFGFDLPQGTSDEGAEETAKYLNENIREFTFTAIY